MFELLSVIGFIFVVIVAGFAAIAVGFAVAWSILRAFGVVGRD